jgi:hypothetical protein
VDEVMAKKLILLLFIPFVLEAQWISAYYCGFRLKWCTPSEIDYSAVTHLIHFSLGPNSNGTLDAYVNGIWGFDAAHDAATRDLISRAHAVGRKVLICIGGWNTESSWVGATNSTNRTKFIGNIIAFVQDHGYDGVDVDWEQLTNTSAFNAFIPALYQALKAANPNYLLTIACTGEAAVAQNQQYFDQINLMTYDMSGAWPGWVVWFNSPLFNGGYTFPSVPSKQVPCIQNEVDEFAGRGVPRSKIGFGSSWEAFIWSNVSEPRQDAAPASGHVQGNVLLVDMLAQYGSLQVKWDAIAHAAYRTSTSPARFISYESEQAVHDKVQWMKQGNAGGMILWSLGAGYLRGQTVPDPLLQAVKSAMGGIEPPPPPPPIDTTQPPPSSPCDSAGYRQAGYTAGYGDGYTEGKTQGYTDGFRDGRASVQVPDSAAIYSLAYSRGFADGKAQAVHDTVWIPVPGPHDTVWVPIPGTRDTVYLPGPPSDASLDALKAWIDGRLPKTWQWQFEAVPDSILLPIIRQYQMKAQ